MPDRDPALAEAELALQPADAREDVDDMVRMGCGPGGVVGRRRVGGVRWVWREAVVERGEAGDGGQCWGGGGEELRQCGLELGFGLERIAPGAAVQVSVGVVKTGLDVWP